MSRSRVLGLLAIVSLLISALPSRTLAALPDCGVDLTPLEGWQQFPAVAPDGAGGAFVVWPDGSFDGHEMYALRLTASGQVAPGWPARGVPLSTAFLDASEIPEIVPDGTGGAIVAWTGVYRAVVFAQRVTASGEIAPGWPVEGLQVCSFPSRQLSPKLCADGEGGAIIMWSDNRSGTWDVYALRIAGTGAIAAGWPADGLAIASLPANDGSFSAASIAPDGSGGAYIAWQEDWDDVSALRLQRVSGSGTIVAGWPEEGIVLGDGLPGFAIVPDDLHGVFLGWVQPGYIPLVQRVTGSGAIQPDWPTGGVALSTDICPYLQLIADGTGGAIATWTVFTSFVGGDPTFIHTQRIDASGNTLWATNGVRVALLYAGNGISVSDGSGGVVVAWASDKTRAQRITADGNFAPGWGEGVVLCSASSSYLVMAPVCGGAIVAWYRHVSVPLRTNVFAQLVGLDGSVGEIDAAPPTLTVELTPDVLFPPTHQLAMVHADVEVTSDCPPAVVRLASITSSEPDNGLGDGDTADDIQSETIGAADFEFQLRAERAANGPGRTYTVCYEATDGTGLTVQQCAEVKVPRAKNGNAALTESATKATLVIYGSAEMSAASVAPAAVVLGTDSFHQFMPSSSERSDDNSDGFEDLILALPPAAERAELGAGSLEAMYAYWEAGDQSYTARVNLVADVPEDGTGGRLAAWLRPNPAKGAAVLHFRMPAEGQVRVTILDVAGRVVAEPIHAWQPAGVHRVSLHASLPAEGLYLYRVQTPSGTATGKFVFMK